MKPYLSTGGEDYYGGSFAKEIEAFSPTLESCVQIEIKADGLVENTETFAVVLDVSCSTGNENYEFEGKLDIVKESTRITIEDASTFQL